MASLRQRKANRLNALSSSGPKTEAGKRRSSVNALRHGLTVPVEYSSWAPHESSLSQVLITEGLSDHLALEMARLILDYERNVEQQRDAFVKLMIAHLGYTPEVKVNLTMDQRVEQKPGSRVLRALNVRTRRSSAPSRYLRRAASQLIRRCRKLGSGQ